MAKCLVMLFPVCFGAANQGAVFSSGEGKSFARAACQTFYTGAGESIFVEKDERAAGPLMAIVGPRPFFPCEKPAKQLFFLHFVVIQLVIHYTRSVFLSFLFYIPLGAVRAVSFFAAPATYLIFYC